MILRVLRAAAAFVAGAVVSIVFAIRFARWLFDGLQR